MSSNNSLVTFKNHIFLMSIIVYFTPVVMDKEKLIADWKITGFEIHLSHLGGMNVAASSQRILLCSRVLSTSVFLA